MSRETKFRFDAEQHRRMFFARERPKIHLLLASIWGQAERHSIDRLRAIDPREVVRPYLQAAGLTDEHTAGLAGEVKAGLAGELTGEHTAGLTGEPTGGHTAGLTGEVKAGLAGEYTAGLARELPIESDQAAASRWPAHTEAGLYLSACAHAMSSRVDPELYERLSSVVVQLERCQAQHSRLGRPAGYLYPDPPERMEAILSAPHEPAAVRLWREIAALLTGLLDVMSYTSIDCAPIVSRLGSWAGQLIVSGAEPNGDEDADPAEHGGTGAADQVNVDVGAARRDERAPPDPARGRWSIAISLARLAVAMGQRRDVRIAASKLHDPARPIVPDRELSDSAELERAIDDAVGAVSLFVLGEDAGFAEAEQLWLRLVSEHVLPDGSVRGIDRSAAISGAARTVDPNGVSDRLTGRTVELACVLLGCDPDSRYADYLELAGSNYLSVVASPFPEGGAASEVPMGPAVHMDWPHRVGSPREFARMMTRLRLRQWALTQRADEVWVNLFIAATLEVPGSGGVEIVRISPGHYRLDIFGEVPGKLRVRWPDYASSMRLRINEEWSPAMASPDGYVVVPGERRPGESIDVEFDWSVRVIRSELDPDRFAIAYGPWQMVALSDWPTWLQWPPREIERVLRAAGPDGPWLLDSIPLVPLRIVGEGTFHSVFADPGF